jgi:hypothetical protein
MLWFAQGSIFAQKALSRFALKKGVRLRSTEGKTSGSAKSNVEKEDLLAYVYSSFEGFSNRIQKMNILNRVSRL